MRPSWAAMIRSWRRTPSGKCPAIVTTPGPRLVGDRAGGVPSVSGFWGSLCGVFSVSGMAVSPLRRTARTVPPSVEQDCPCANAESKWPLLPWTLQAEHPNTLHDSEIRRGQSVLTFFARTPNLCAPLTGVSGGSGDRPSRSRSGGGRSRAKECRGPRGVRPGRSPAAHRDRCLPGSRFASARAAAFCGELTARLARRTCDVPSHAAHSVTCAPGLVPRQTQVQDTAGLSWRFASRKPHI